MKKWLLLIALSLSTLAKAEVLPAPAWMSSATVYQVFIRNHTSEGTFQAALPTLADAKDLGVNTIYLLPFYPTGEKERKGTLGSPYSVKEYTLVDPAQGTLEDFRAYVEEAHRLGLRVMIDIVFNHTAWDTSLITEHPDWYLKNQAGKIIPPNPEWSDVAALDTSHPEVQKHLISVGEFWLKQGVDGFRADHSSGVPLSFWQKFRTAMKAINPEVLLLAETGNAPYHDRAFDLSYDWDGMSRVVGAGLNLISANRFFDYQNVFPEVPKLRYLENHDQERMASKLTTDFQRKAAAGLLLTEPGVPLIYAGQEVGLTERPSLFDPAPLDWSRGDDALREVYQKLLNTRAKLQALHTGELRLIAGQPRNVAAFVRFTPQQKVVVLINFAGTPQEVNLPWAKVWTDQITAKSFPGGTWTLSPGETQILLDH